MKTTFENFIQKNPICRKFDGDAGMILIFNLLSEDKSIIQMIDACDSGKPALTPMAKPVEALADTLKNPTISLDDDFTRQAVGLMVKSILEPFGYRGSGKKALPKEYKGEKFVTASCYRLDPEAPASMRVVKRIEEF